MRTRTLARRIIRTMAFLGLGLVANACAQSETEKLSNLASEGPPAEFDQPKAGTEFTFDVEGYGELTYEVTDVNPQAYTLQGAHDSARVHAGIFPVWSPQNWELQKDNVRQLWPMEVGDEAFVVLKYKRSPRGWLAKWSVEVMGYTEIEVPAGTFDAYVIRQDVGNNHNTYSGTTVYWYAPEIDMVVKREFELHKGNNDWPDFELVARQPAQA